MMELTEVRVKLVERREDRLKAFCTVIIDDCFAIREIKILDGEHGPFLAMPNRRLTDHCGVCGGKNYLLARFCNDCGVPLPVVDLPCDGLGHARLYADIAHPINASCREMIQRRVLEEFQMELQRANAGFVPTLTADSGHGLHERSPDFGAA